MRVHACLTACVQNRIGTPENARSRLATVWHCLILSSAFPLVRERPGGVGQIATDAPLAGDLFSLRHAVTHLPRNSGARLYADCY